MATGNGLRIILKYMTNQYFVSIWEAHYGVNEASDWVHDGGPSKGLWGSAEALPEEAE